MHLSIVPEGIPTLGIASAVVSASLFAIAVCGTDRSLVIASLVGVAIMLETVFKQGLRTTQYQRERCAERWRVNLVAGITVALPFVFTVSHLLRIAAALDGHSSGSRSITSKKRMRGGDDDGMPTVDEKNKLIAALDKCKFKSDYRTIITAYINSAQSGKLMETKNFQMRKMFQDIRDALTNKFPEELETFESIQDAAARNYTDLREALLSAKQRYAARFLDVAYMEGIKRGDLLYPTEEFATKTADALTSSGATDGVVDIWVKLTSLEGYDTRAVRPKDKGKAGPNKQELFREAKKVAKDNPGKDDVFDAVNILAHEDLAQAIADADEADKEYKTNAAELAKIEDDVTKKADEEKTLKEAISAATETDKKKKLAEMVTLLETKSELLKKLPEAKLKAKESETTASAARSRVDEAELFMKELEEAMKDAKKAKPAGATPPAATAAAPAATADASTATASSPTPPPPASSTSTPPAPTPGKGGDTSSNPKKDAASSSGKGGLFKNVKNISRATSSRAKVVIAILVFGTISIATASYAGATGAQSAAFPASREAFSFSVTQEVEKKVEEVAEVGSMIPAAAAMLCGILILMVAYAYEFDAFRETSPLAIEGIACTDALVVLAWSVWYFGRNVWDFVTGDLENVSGSELLTMHG